MGYNMSKWESELLDTVNEQRKYRNMPPLTRESLATMGNFFGEKEKTTSE